MNGVTPNDALRMVQTTRELVDDLCQYFMEGRFQQAENSMAGLELRNPSHVEILQSAYTQGIVLIAAATDHASAFTRMLIEPVHSVAPWVAVRALLEASALASWLLDPNLDARTRIERSFALQYDGLAQQEKIVRLMGRHAEVAKVIAKIDELERQAISLGYPEVKNKNQRRCGVGRRMPSLTDIIELTLREGILYRILSGAAHAHPPVIRQLGFEVAERAIALNGQNATEDSGWVLEQSMTSEAVAFLCVRVAHLLARPIWYWCRLFGRDDLRLASILDNVSTSLGIPVRARFWYR